MATPDELQAQSDWRRYAALGAVGSTFVGSILLMSPFVVMQLRSELPYMSTPRRKVLKALKFISERQPKRTAETKSNTCTTISRTFYDLGSGDGEAVLAAAEAGWTAVGIEMNPTLWLISQLRRLWSPAEVRQRSRFVLGDMFAKHRICSADAVMVFGVRPLMPRIADKISAECDGGTFVMSYRFRIPTVGNVSDDNGGNDDRSNEGKLDAEMVFDEDEMRILEMSTSLKCDIEGADDIENEND